MIEWNTDLLNNNFYFFKLSEKFVAKQKFQTHFL